jgi:hypothetical protein
LPSSACPTQDALGAVFWTWYDKTPPSFWFWFLQSSILCLSSILILEDRASISAQPQPCHILLDPTTIISGCNTA